MQKIQFSCFFETAAAVVLLVLLNWAFFPDYPAYLAIHPHPYFALVILISLRYGRVESLLSTLLISAALWLQSTRGVLADSPGITDEVGQRVVLFIILNLVLGELGSVFNREVDEARAQLRQLREEHEALKVKYNALAMVKEELSERIVGQTSSIVSLYEAAKSLESLDLDEVQESLLSLTSKFIGIESCSLFWLREDEGVFELVKTHGWTDREIEERGRLTFAFGHGAVGLAAAESRMFTLNELGERHEAGQGESLPSIMVAPLVVGGRVVAVVNVEKIPFLKFTPTAIRLFYLIADLGSSAIAKSTRLSAFKEISIVDPESGLHTSAYFESRFRDELSRFTRTRVTFAYVLMQVDRFDSIQKLLRERTGRFVRELAGLVFANKRDLDVAASTGKPGEFHFLLPLTGTEGVLAFAAKMHGEVLSRITIGAGDKVFRPTAHFGGAVCAEDAQTAKALVSLAGRALLSASEAGPNAVRVLSGRPDGPS